MPHHDPFQLREVLGEHAALCRRAITLEAGVSLPPLVDHHVHLHLIDERRLGAHGIAAVVDLGGDPVELSRRPPHGMPMVTYAGAFLTAPGGYPVGRSWLSAKAVREVSSASLHPGVAGGVATAVDEQVSFGASVIKIALNAQAGAVPDAATVAAVVAATRAHALPVVAHVQGDGMARVAIDAGVDVLAHTPFTEELEPSLIRTAAANGQRWISTLAIHRHDSIAGGIASANLSRFLDAGGVVLYGTDLGNGDLPTGVNAVELAELHRAGLRGEALLESLIDPWPRAERSYGVATFVPGAPPKDADAVPAWLARAKVVPTEELVHDEHS